MRRVRLLRVVTALVIACDALLGAALLAGAAVAARSDSLVYEVHGPIAVAGAVAASAVLLLISLGRRWPAGVHVDRLSLCAGQAALGVAASIVALESYLPGRLLAAVLTAIGVNAALACWYSTRNGRGARDRCCKCDYDLRGLKSPLCPECGAVTCRSCGASIPECGSPQRTAT
jgi:hypothetical protein